MRLSRAKMGRTWAGAVGIAVVLLAGCAPGQIPGTHIEDTPEAHAVLDVLERYRSALEHRDAPALLAVVSPSFRDTGGTPNPDDDLDYASLQKKFAERLAKVDEVRVDLDVRSVDFPKPDLATAVFFFTMHFRMPKLTNKTQTESDLKQTTLRKENGAWRILKGI